MYCNPVQVVNKMTCYQQKKKATFIHKITHYLYISFYGFFYSFIHKQKELKQHKQNCILKKQILSLI